VTRVVRLTGACGGGIVSGMSDRSDTPRLPAGEFSAWLRAMRAALAGDADSDVPCGDCCACCSTSHFVHIDVGEAEALACVPADLRFAAPGGPPGSVVLPYDERGRCPLLDADGRCAIYDCRPRTCRVYDCRVFAAADLASDRGPITDRAARWEFTYADDRARAEHAAVGAAARFILDNAALFPGGAVPDGPAQLAVLAVKVADVFLAGGRGDARSLCAGAGPEVARAVVEAARR
jgi:Fe-S-cluster containining protein